MRKILLFAVSIFCFSLILPVQAKAENVVQPILIIPKNWDTRITPEMENKYKQSILDALAEVQTWYSSKANGKTYKYVNKVDVRRIDEKIGDPTYFNKISDKDDRKDIAQEFWKLGNNDFLFYTDDTLHIFWLVGSGEGPGWGGYTYRNGSPARKVSFALMTHENLISLEKGRDPEQRNVELGIVAHELGHGFHLVYAGRAKGHPCSEVSINECEGSPPYPTANEWNGNIMGSQWLYPDTGFTNTTDNPVLEKLYQSLFVNPQRDPAPKPIRPPKKAVTNSVTPKNLKNGQTFEIHGSGFGENIGSVFFKSTTGGFEEFKQFTILVWSDKRIIGEILNNADKFPYLRTYFTQVITNEFKESVVEGDNVLSIAPQVSVPKAVPINISATCGSTNQPFLEYKVSFHQLTADLQNILISEAYSNKEGKATVVLVEPKVGYYKITLTPLIDGQVPNTFTKLFEVKKDEPMPNEMTQNFNLPQCPTLVLTTTPTPTTTPALEPESLQGLKKNNIHNVEAYSFCEQYDGDVDACDANKCAYFLCTNQCYPDGVSEKVVCAGENQLQTIPNQPISSCENKYYWDPNAKDGVGTCIHKLSSKEGNTPPKCDYIFDPADDEKCPDKPTEQESIIQTPTPTNQEAQRSLTGIILSNYEDFRDTNVPGDEGSITSPFSPQEGQSIDWTLSTLSPHSPIHIRRLFSDETFEDSELTLGNGQTANIDFLAIRIHEIKKVTEILINGQSVDINDPGLSLHLDGTEGQAQDFSVPVLIKYSNGEESSTEINIRYRPAVPEQEGDNTSTQDEQSENPPDQTQPGTAKTQPEPQTTQSPQEAPQPQDSCDDLFYWDDGANDDEGGCIYKHTDNSWPDCEPYAFDGVDSGNCGR